MWLVIFASLLLFGAQDVLGRKPLPKPEQFENTKWQLVQGDLLVPRDLNDTKGRFMVKDEYYRWPNRRVPYVLHEEHFDEKAMAVINAGLEYLEEILGDCITIEPKGTWDQAWLSIQGNEDGCFAYLGHDFGERKLNIGKGCETKGIFLHEFGHALGFEHESLRWDREDYVIIHWENIKEDEWSHIAVPSKDKMTTLDLPYDIYSVMHHEWWEMSSVPGEPAWTAVDPNIPKEDIAKGASQGFYTELDQKKVRKAYKC